MIRKVDRASARRCSSLLGRDDVEDLIERTLFSVEGGDAAGARLVEKGCTAIVCGSDLMALGAIRAARRAGLRVPEDVSVVGYDDSPLIAFTDPPLTTVRQTVPAMGAAAVRALLDEIAGSPAPRAEYVFRPELVVRGSTGGRPPPTESGPAERVRAGREQVDAQVVRAGRRLLAACRPGTPRRSRPRRP